MIQAELKEIIEALKDINSDNSHIEIKSGEGGFPKRIWETISAFVNTSGGGIIILGISETEEGIFVNGVKDPAKFQSDLASICSQMNPPIRPLIEIHKYESKMLVTAEIPEVSYKEKPCYYQGSGIMSGSYIRVADGDRHLTQYEVQSFLDGRGQPLYDIEQVAEADINDLEPELIKLFIERIKEKLPKTSSWDENKIMQTYRILTDTNGKQVPTLVGLLCLGSYPQKFFPGLSLHILVYPTKTEGQTGPQGERLIDNIKLEGPLLRIVPEAIKAIKRNIQTRIIVKGLFREDILEYPEIFLREAVINALGHRDYSPLARGTSVQIKIFPDRIEINNPGGLFGPITEDRLGEQGLQATRNAYLMKLLEDLPVPGENQVLCENRGTGIPAMISTLIKAGMEPPQFLDFRNQFKVICFNEALFDRDTLSWLEKYSNIDLTDKQRFALAYIKHKGKLTNPEYCRINDCDSRIANKELGELARKSILIQHGMRRWTHYTISDFETTGPVAGIEKISKVMRKNRRAEIINIIKLKGTANREEIRKEINMSQETVLYWIRKLIKEKKIEPTTSSTRDPNVRYKIRR